MPETFLDERLAMIARRVDARAQWVADIGSDHGRLACALLAERPTLRMIVADISADSLSKARLLLSARGLSHRAEFCVADGLDALKGRQGASVDAIVLAGMGAKTIREILAAGRARIGEAVLILQPNVDAPKLRGWLTAHGFVICGEDIARANGRFYVILSARCGASPELTPKQKALGPCLLTERPAAFMPYLQWRKRVLTHVAGRLAAAQEPARAHLAVRYAACVQELAWIEEELLCV